MNRIIYFVVLVGVFVSCNYKTKREERLEAQADSLRSELQVSQQMAETLMEVGTLIDSIDASRNNMRTDLVEGTGYNDYVKRLQDIHVYVDASYKKITDLEKELRKSKSGQASYLASIKRLKIELEQKGKEVEALQATVAKYEQENSTLVNTVALQGAELSDKTDQLMARQNEVSKLQEEVQMVINQSKFDLADAYFRQAQALELAADRTKLAPRKKKSTQKEALELYRLAVATGKAEAQQKVEELEAKI